MPESNSYEMMIKFVMDNQGAEKALKTMTDFNNSVKNLTIGLDELDKKGLSTFEKLINTLTSSRTGNAVQQLNSLSAALRSLGISAAQISGVQTIGGGGLGAPGGIQMIPWPERKSERASDGITANDIAESQRSSYMAGLISPGVYSGGGAGGGMYRTGGTGVGNFGGILGALFNLRGANQNLADLLGFGIPKIYPGGLGGPENPFAPDTLRDVYKKAGGGFFGAIAAGGTLAGAVSPYVLAAMAGGYAIQGVSNAVNYFDTLESVSQAAVQRAERAPSQMAMSGDLTLSLLERLEIGEAVKRKRMLNNLKYDFDETAANNYKNVTLIDYLKAAQVGIQGGQGFFGSMGAGLAGLFGFTGTDIFRQAQANYESGGQQLDLSRYGELGKFVGQAQKLYEPFNRSYQLYGERSFESDVLTRFSTLQEAQAAEQLSVLLGMRSGDISQNVTFARRFGFAPEAVKATAAFDPGGTRVSQEYLAILNAVGAPKGAEEMYTAAMAPLHMQALGYGGTVNTLQALSSFYAAGRGVYDSGKLEDQANVFAQRQRMTSFLEKQKEPGKLTDVALVTAFQSLGVTNVYEAQQLAKLQSLGRTKDVDAILKNYGINAGQEDIRSKVETFVRPFVRASLTPVSQEGMEAFAKRGIDISSLTGIKPGASMEDVRTRMFVESAVAPDLDTTKDVERERGGAPAFTLQKSQMLYIVEGIKSLSELKVKTERGETLTLTAVNFLSESFRKMSDELKKQVDEIKTKGNAPNTNTGPKNQ